MEKDKTIEVLKKDCEGLIIENTRLKQQICGFKQSNANYREQVRELRARVEHYKELCIEGDRLYEGKIAEMEDASKRYKTEFEAYKNQRSAEFSQVIRGHEKAMDDKERVISGLSAQVRELIEKKNALEMKVSANEDYIRELELTVDVLRTPWWKRMFR